MAGSSRSVRAATELQMHKKWKDRETSPERTKVWTESSNSKLKHERKVPVVYYLTRNGQLEHPHFMEVPLSSSDGLYLRDVINRLNFLRGKGMASLYSWSAKRSYRNGFVWHDLAEHDFIYPAHGQEYVLKGSELVDGAMTVISQSQDEVEFSSSSKNQAPEVHDFPAVSRRRNQSWCSADFHEYRVYKAESSNESAGKAAADAATQTDDPRRRRREIGIAEEEEEEENYTSIQQIQSHSTELSRGEISGCMSIQQTQNHSTELSRGEISPPPSDSSPETLETLMKAEGRVIVRPETVNEDQTADNNSNQSSVKSKGSSVFMQLLSCGSISFKDCGPGGYVKDHGLNLISHYKSRVPRGTGLNNQVEKDVENTKVEYHNNGIITKLVEDKEYFSGSLIETNKDEYPALMRSSSFNADRNAKLEIREKEIEGVRTTCIPRRPKNQSTTRNELASNDLSCSWK
ncbi:protein SOSEKI 5 isoform X1 [Lycium ferocissimum]|uniref:protein SOSEKI 5 isoform X1 n=2 Tax=Lycium ferocissimum TaxID=112874 RepID=UPI00281498BB|nr:protein SOSEKI 5 isoform X1 [Lycium ferocissimum]